MLELGLQRITKLVNASGLPWRAIHVAGTNGKGSVCAYASSMLKAAGVPVGRFTSPHLVDRWDCITIDDQIISENLFASIEDQVRWKNQRLKVGATEFELLTATAFEAFTQQRVDVGVIEVGLGGLRDATNVLENPLATVISRIGLDHEALLGNSLPEIATEKAGIMKPGAPCFVDYENKASVGETLRSCADLYRAGMLRFVSADSSAASELWTVLDRSRYARHQQVGIALAHEAVQSALQQMGLQTDPEKVISSVASTVWPARLQWLSLSKVTTRIANVLLDGAHNPQAAKVLSTYVDTELRLQAKEVLQNHSVTWVLAASQGKDVSRIFGELIRELDRVVAVDFGPVDGMPWVSSIAAVDLAQQLNRYLKEVQLNNVSVYPSPDLHSALRLAAELAGEGALVIAGSLYLAADVLRLLRDHNHRN